MAGDGPVLDVGGTVTDHGYVQYTSGVEVRASVGPLLRTSGAEPYRELLAERAASLNKQGPAHGRMRHAHRWITRVVPIKSGRVLLGRAALSQPAFDLMPQPGV